MRHFRLLAVVFAAVLCVGVRAEQLKIFVKAGDANGLLAAIDQVNQTNQDRDAERAYIFLPDGVYNLGDRVLTTLKGHNIAIVGQSMNGTIITNHPDVKQEGISKTATLLNRGTGLYLQDLTLMNALEYYKAGSAGRAVCLQDKGTRTICKRVRMLSYQDTYYSDNEDGQMYFENSEIHGTVDFICGASDVYFNRCAIVTEPRNIDGSGRNVIAAPRTSHTPWGYVFEGCVVYNRQSEFQWARGWHTSPRCTWLNTTLVTPEKLKEPRFDPNGMRTVQSDFHEYGTVDLEGRNITPASNIVTFTLKDEKNSVETILTKKQARRYSLKKIFPDWRPELLTARLSQEIREMNAFGQ